jgi:hypothetical protein
MADPTQPCFSCGGAYHPSTGDWDPAWKIARCETCYKAFLSWMKGHTAREWNGHDFYVEARTSVHPGVTSSIQTTTYVRVPNPKASEKVSKRPGRWRAGPDGVKVALGPKPVRPFTWVKVGTQ